MNGRGAPVFVREQVSCFNLGHLVAGSIITGGFSMLGWLVSFCSAGVGGRGLPVGFSSRRTCFTLRLFVKSCEDVFLRKDARENYVNVLGENIGNVVEWDLN